MTGPRAWSLVGAALAVCSLGLSWAGQVSGAAHPSRVPVVLTVVLAVAAWRTGRDRLLTAAVAVGAVGLLLGGVDASPGRLLFAAALGCLLVARSGAHRPAARGVREPAG